MAVRSIDKGDALFKIYIDFIFLIQIKYKYIIKIVLMMISILLNKHISLLEFTLSLTRDIQVAYILYIVVLRPY